ncbi:MAG: hypothetical protein V5A43_06680 [Haloarculaceae archaeon]
MSSLESIASPVVITAVKTVTLLLGGLITYLGYRAYRRTGARSLRALSAGFGLITVGSLLAGVADLVLGTPIEVGLLIESSLIAVGFGIIVYSLYLTEP